MGLCVSKLCSHRLILWGESAYSLTLMYSSAQRM